MVGKFPFQNSYINRGGYGRAKCFLRVASLYRLPQSRELELRWGLELSFEILAGQVKIEWLAERQRRHRCGKGQERVVQPLDQLNLKHTGPLGWRREWSADGHSLCLGYGPVRFCLPNPCVMDDASPEELLFRPAEAVCHCKEVWRP